MKKDIKKIVKEIRQKCYDFLGTVDALGNECASTDRMIERIYELAQEAMTHEYESVDDEFGNFVVRWGSYNDNHFEYKVFDSERLAKDLFKSKLKEILDENNINATIYEAMSEIDVQEEYGIFDEAGADIDGDISIVLGYSFPDNSEVILYKEETKNGKE